VDFFPSYINALMNFVTVCDSNRGSAGVSLRSARERRLIS